MESKSTKANKETSHELILVYPNPTSGFINFKMDNLSLNFNFELWDLMGRKLYSKQFNGLNAAEGLDIRHLANGLYLYKILPQHSKPLNGVIVLKK